MNDAILLSLVMEITNLNLWTKTVVLTYFCAFINFVLDNHFLYFTNFYLQDPIQLFDHVLSHTIFLVHFLIELSRSSIIFVEKV